MSEPVESSAPENGADQATQQNNGTEPQTTQATSTPPAKRSLEELLTDLDDDSRKTVLEQVSKARREAADYRARLRDVEPKAAEYDKALEAKKSVEQKAQEAAAAAEQRAADLLARAVKAEIKSRASKFADPSDAADALDASAYITQAGDIDTAGIDQALADLLDRKPHWAKPAESGPRRPAPDPSQGSSGNRQPSKAPRDIFAGFLSQQLTKKN